MLPRLASKVMVLCSDMFVSWTSTQRIPFYVQLTSVGPDFVSTVEDVM